MPPPPLDLDGIGLARGFSPLVDEEEEYSFKGPRLGREASPQAIINPLPFILRRGPHRKMPYSLILLNSTRGTTHTEQHPDGCSEDSGPSNHPPLPTPHHSKSKT